MVSRPSCRAEAVLSSQVVSTPASMMFGRTVGDALVVERRGAQAAAPVRVVGDGDGLGEHLLAELALQERDAAGHRRPGDRADQRPQQSRRRGGSRRSPARWSRRSCASRGAATARRPASAPICFGGRQVGAASASGGPRRPAPSPSPRRRSRRRRAPKLEARCSPEKPSLVTSRQAPRDQQAELQSELVTPGDRPRGVLGRPAPAFSSVSASGSAGSKRSRSGSGAAGQPIVRRQAGVGVLGRQLGHRHDPLDQLGAAFRRDVGAGDGGLAAADEDAHAEVAALLALDFLQRAQPHGHRQRLALGEHRLGGVGAGRPRLGDHLLQHVFIHAAHMADGRPRQGGAHNARR